MRLKQLAAALALTGAAVGALGLLTASANAQPRQRALTSDRTVVVTHDENGRTRTRIIIQKRSYLDPGTEAIPGDPSVDEYAFLPGQRANDVLDNTTFGATQSPLPGPFTLPSKNNPWLEFSPQ
jgi:hypothetical protein